MFTVACAPRAPPPPLDVVAKVTAAKKIFVSNAGADVVFISDRVGGVNESYNARYASLKQWGYFQLVNSPTESDFVFEILSTQQSADVDHTGIGFGPHDYTVTPHSGIFNLSILDPSTRTLIYKIVSPSGQGGTSKKGQISFANAITTLTDRIKALVAAPAAAAQNP